MADDDDLGGWDDGPSRQSCTVAEQRTNLARQDSQTSAASTKSSLGGFGSSLSGLGSFWKAGKSVGKEVSTTRETAGRAVSAVTSVGSVTIGDPDEPAGRASAPEGSAADAQSRTSYVAGGLASAASASTSLVTVGFRGVGSLLGVGAGAGCGEHDPSAQLALGLTGAFVELLAASAASCDVDDRSKEVGALLDSVVAARHLSELASRLAGFWYIARPELLSDWPLPMQLQWLHSVQAVRHADLSKHDPSGSQLARSMCGLLLELGAAFRTAAPWWDASEGQGWSQSLFALAELAEESSTPAGWVFPTWAITQRSPQMNQDGDAAPATFCVLRREAATHRFKGSDMVTMLADGSRRVHGAPRQRASGGDADAARGLVLEMSALAPNPAVRERCAKDAKKLFMQKTRPIKLHNQASTPLKVCIFKENDLVCAVPLGGVGGPSSITLEAGLRAQMRPPSRAETFQMIVYTPGLIERAVYTKPVTRGQSVELRTNDCVIE